MTRAILAAALTAGLALTAACGTDGTRSPSMATGKPALTIGIAYHQPGLSVMDSGGKPQGFDADTARYIADKLGALPEKITWKEVAPDQREQVLTSGAVDFVVATYSITTGRMERVTFAGPYLVTGQDLLVRKDDPSINRPEDLGGRSVCTAQGTTAADNLRAFTPEVNLTTREDYSACVDDLLAGTVDAVSTDDVILAGYAAQHPERLRLTGYRFTKERYGVGIKKGDTGLQGKITQAIRDMIADGSWEKSISTHLTPEGYQPQPAPAVFNAPDKTVTAGDPADLDQDLVTAVDSLVENFNKQDWEAFGQLTCPEAKDDIDRFVMRNTPRYDERLGPELVDAGFVTTVTGIQQTGSDAAAFLAREAFTNVPDKYRRYFADIDYTGVMERRDGQWKLCQLSADFVQP
ncbi:glutamate ABC transporter substrate-binding protein [Nocardia huaxiensis]|uniref:glutamate ABC transporter substrate-binding protein n=1 Tax=Nocardia huaxiensis TaxID=2755382 RepID=UPI001E3DA7CD|nr:glutamate ABC transporter substrate-binding protein [Nocardia huaxiensis]UFS96158.1 glutamate ABC transporter substrate-binding protein [Nocardia huaxiensis]